MIAQRNFLVAKIVKEALALQRLAKVTEADGKRRKKAEEGKVTTAEEAQASSSNENSPEPSAEPLDKRKMTREEVREDLQRLKQARTEPVSARRSRRMTPEERLRIRGLSASAAASPEERAEEAAASAPAPEDDELENAQGETKKARIHLAKEAEERRTRIVAYLELEPGSLGVRLRLLLRSR